MIAKFLSMLCCVSGGSTSIVNTRRLMFKEVQLVLFVVLGVVVYGRVVLVDSAFVQQQQQQQQSSVNSFSMFRTKTTTTQPKTLFLSSSHHFQSKGTTTTTSKSYFYPSSSSRVLLQMVVTPVGPFCPFRSEAAISMEPRMGELNELGPTIALEMQKIQLEFQVLNMMGDKDDMDDISMIQKKLNTTHILSTAIRLEDAVDKWVTLLQLLENSNDFQTKEYSTLTKVHLEESSGSSSASTESGSNTPNTIMTYETVASMLKWQAGCMKAMATNTPPPMPPSNINWEQYQKQMMMDQESSSSSSPSMGLPSVSAMSSSSPITAVPFTGTESIFTTSPVVKVEYDQLCTDHQNLIQYGNKYGTFDRMGKIIYLQQISTIMERWDIFFTRFQLMNKINPLYVQQCNEFLKGMNMNEDQYRIILKRCHERMKEEAERM